MNSYYECCVSLWPATRMDRESMKVTTIQVQTGGYAVLCSDILDKVLPYITETILPTEHRSCRRERIKLS